VVQDTLGKMTTEMKESNHHSKRAFKMLKESLEKNQAQLQQ